MGILVKHLTKVDKHIGQEVRGVNVGLDEIRSQMLFDTKDFLIEYYNYKPEQILIDYPINLTDGTIEIVDLVITTRRDRPYMIIYVTTEIPEDKIKKILLKSNLLIGAVRQLKSNDIPEFWGIRKRRTLIGYDFQSIDDYPKSTILFNLFEILMLPY